MAPILPALAFALTLPAGGQAPEAQTVLAASNAFGFDLYGRLGGQGGNVFLSPYSVAKTLAMAYTGARGETATEMAAVLHLPLGPERVPLAFADARRLLNSRGSGVATWAKPGKASLHLAAALWGQQGHPFDRTFLARLEEGFGAGLYGADFQAPEQARRAINTWAARQTHDKIKDLFPPASLDVNTRLVLASAIYFKDDWANPFPKGSTRQDAFYPAANRPVRVPMMNQTATLGYGEDGDVQVLEMPYEDRGLAMVIVLPRRADGLAEVEKTLTAERWAGWVGRLREQKVEVFLPKFKLTSAFSLKDALEGLGMRLAFGGGADFGGMDGGREPLYLSAVLHQAFVDVNEEGTEAAAATGAAVAALAAPLPAATPVFRADHPFLFAVRDVRTGTLLFLGRLAQP
jgi:serpin B